MYFSDFASLCSELEKMPSRLAKIAAASEYLKRLEPGEIRSAVAFLSGRPFPVSDPRTLDIGAAALFGASADAENGTAEPFNSLPANAGALTITDVAEALSAVAEASGKGSRREKSERLRDLIGKT